MREVALLFTLGNEDKFLPKHFLAGNRFKNALETNVLVQQHAVGPKVDFARAGPILGHNPAG